VLLFLLCTQGLAALAKAGVIIVKAKTIQGDAVGNRQGAFNPFLKFGL
jgi:hypothetical protein